MTADAPHLKLKAQLLCGDTIAMGPGKADLLEAVRATGSISAAGRALGFSYRRTWLLVDTMNRAWREPLVATAHGGVKGGGAVLTPLGESVLGQYRALEAAIAKAAAKPAAALLAGMLPAPRA
ncbi:LysR family transcriptional regulator [Polymorphobacter arshaanensis]|uniref:LysR family transcriptional regulator n=1 Tax=Glacieibacterium arshaanense TaxID=2511025 RepID=A0A4Y9EMT1_9SPHN|nr:LysR family transcriptional regulator [Polymorphobacter arshaanensis]TFU01485.1 LysR family transcriptional regulator [Polymorphobacter arshaanensis]